MRCHTRKLARNLRYSIVAIALSFLQSNLVFADARFYDSEGGIETIVSLIKRRLELMPEVAAWKWNHDAPITDLERERVVLERSVAQATELGLDADAARTFFEVQIKMARDIQQMHFDAWRTQSGIKPKERDLNTVIRPELDEIGKQLLLAIYLASADLQQPSSEQSVDRQLSTLGVDPRQREDVKVLRTSLLGLHRKAAPTLDVIKRAGVIRVGTTGDYAPFSFERAGSLSGIDVELAEQFATQLGATVVFVRTTWRSLMSDLQQHRFDVAMSGISVTPDRQRIAQFSAPYYQDGKTPIARCADKRKFASLAAIDKPNVRVIVNPGGTNERFVHDHLRNAQVIVHQDNRTIFDEIIANRADVMITDGVEVKLQTQLHPQLCSTSNHRYAITPKAAMLEKGNADLLAVLNHWLNAHAGEFEVKKFLRQL